MIINSLWKPPMPSNESDLKNIEALSVVAAPTVFSDGVDDALIIYSQTSGIIENVIQKKSHPHDFHRYLALSKNFLKFENYLTVDRPEDFLLFPAMGDVHIHGREDVSGQHCYKEDYQSVKAAAENGGVSFVCDMPNNPVPPIDEESYWAKFSLAERIDFPILPYAGIGPKTRPLERLVPYKVYMGHSVGDLYFKNFTELDETLFHYQNQYVSFHCEDPILLEKNLHAENHFLKRPVTAEVVATKDALSLIEKYHLHGKLCHYSSGEGLDLILAAKARGVDVTTEVTPQHLYFSEEELLELDTSVWNQFQMNPPIRKNCDRKRLMHALKNGDIDFLATDHAPHSPEEKLRGTSGLTGLDTYVGFVTWLLQIENVDPTIILKVCCHNPGKFFNRFHQAWGKGNGNEKEKVRGKGIGFLEVGFSASMTLLHRKNGTTITREFLKTKAQSSPFLGHKFPGSLEALWINGRKIEKK